MPVKALVPGVGTIIVENAAEDSTLRQILAAINKNGIPGGGKTGTTAEAPAGAPTTKEQVDKQLKQGAAREEELKARMKIAGDAVALGADSFAKTFSNTTPTIKDFSGVLAQMPGANIAGVRDLVNQFGGTLEDQIQIFRTLSGSGIDLGDSLLQAQLSAGEARLPLEIFGRTVKDNSQMLAMAFGTATAGATKFAETQGKFMAQSGQKFAALGFSMDELATYNASYMEQQQRAGRLTRMSTDEIVAGQERYNQELDRLSKATGLSRQQIDEANKASQRDARMKLALGKLDADQQAAVNAKIKQLEQLDPTGKMAAGFKDIIAGGGVAVTAEARQFALTMQSAGVDAGKMGRDIFNGSKTAIDDMNAGFSKASKNSQNISEGERRTGAAMATMGQFTPMLGKAILQGMQDSSKAAEMAKQEQEKRLAAAKTDPTRAVAGLDQTLTNVQNSFKKSFIESGVLDLTAKGLEKAAGGAEAAANKFAAVDPAARIPVLFGAALGKVIAEEMIKAGVGAAIGAAGAKAAGVDAKRYEELKKGAEPRPGDTKAPKGEPVKPGSATSAADDLAKAEQKMAGLPGRIKWFVAALAGGAGLVAFKDEIVDFVTPDFLKSSTYKNAADAQAERNKNAVPGAEIPKANAPKPPEPPGAEPITKLNQEIDALKTALKDVDYSKLMFPDAVGSSIDSGVIKLKNLREEISTTTSAFKDLNNAKLDQLNTNINKLSDTIKSSMKPEQKEGNGNVKVSDASSKEMVDLLNQLNMTMGQMVSQQSDAVDYLSKTAKYTRQTSNNSA
jgi:hypothetical protein